MVGDSEEYDRTAAPEERSERATPRPGPEPVEADTWGDSAITLTTDYAGRHHARSVSKRRLAIGAGVVVVAIAVVAVPLALSGSPELSPPAAFDPDLGQEVPPGPPVIGGDGISSSPSSGSSGSSGGVVIGGSSSTATNQPPSVTPPVPPTPTASAQPPNPPPFAPVTVEAEAGSPAVTLGGSAWIAPYDGASSGRIARNIGDWDDRSGPGTVRFNGVNFPSPGTYVLTISYVHPDGERSRSAQITVSGLPPVTVNFTGSARCCDQAKVNLTVPAGTRTITIANTNDQAPAVDKITITSA